MQALSDEVAVPTPALSTVAPGESQALAPIVAFLTGAPGPASTVPWASLRRQDIAAIRTWVVMVYPAYVAARLLAALRVATAVDDGEWREDTPGRHLFRVDRSRTVRISRRTSPRDISALLTACGGDQSPAGARDAAIVALIAGAGLTPAEVCTVGIAGYDDSERSVTPGGHRRRIRRTVVLDDVAVAAIDHWLEVRGRGGGPIFYDEGPGGVIREGCVLGRQAIPRLLAQRCREAGLPYLSAADLRGAFYAALREGQRLNPFTANARFSLTDDGQPCLVLPGFPLAGSIAS